MKAIISTLFILIANISFGQNLVADSSFENTLTCPFSFGQIYCPLVAQSWPQTLSTWFSPVPNSPDYYNSCSSDIYSTVPNNYYGYHPAHTGQAYVGIVAYGGYPNSGPQGSYMEYVECQLLQPLTAGQKYHVSFYVNFAVNYSMLAGGINLVSMNTFGIHFSAAQVTSNIAPMQLPFLALQTQPVTFVDDTTQWVQVSGEYTAIGGEQYITIGTFNAPALQLFCPLVPDPFSSYLAYYFIDDVDVSAKAPAPCDSIIIMHDTVTCGVMPAVLTPEYLATTYTWNTGANTTSITINSAGTYWRTAQAGCNFYVDTFIVRLFNNTVYHTHDTFLCADPSITISSIAGATSYQWNTGATTVGINVTQPGTYYCTAVKNCDRYTDTFHVTSYNMINRDHDTTLCFPNTITLSGIANADKYEWNNGPTTPSISATAAGIYTCKAYKGCDLYTDNFTLRNKAITTSINLGNDTSICKENKISIGQSYPDVISYQWNTGETNCCITPQKTGTYSLEVNNGCTTLSDTIDIELVACEDCIYMPTAFTPNGDGKNDQLGIIGKCPLSSFDIKIFNRFGEEVFTSSDITARWNGMYKSQRADIGVYFYMIRYTSAGNMKEHMLKGDVTLIY